ncbi:4Fe-4S binding protein [Adlercreutzia sp. R25]|uniref:4Fe-4S binding protein n=1 Tax=Adlercreutzia shanghongiae TaxID=3111773 RepID=UPI002DBCE6FE|nr:4Fe-4S binding protein [Adlercreutzia sp. R25]MEC4271934.1 4Fe-4S binding protein [Adlercreutzia sp. R25]
MRQTYYAINEKLCCRCGACQRICPHGALVTTRAMPAIDQERCRHCGMCFRACRLGAITRPYELYRLKDGRRRSRTR